MNMPKYVKFLNNTRDDNYCFYYIGNNTYRKCCGGWTIGVKVVEGKIITDPSYENIMHLKNKEFISCTEDDLEKEKEFINL